jgi:hypothetical protein
MAKNRYSYQKKDEKSICGYCIFFANIVVFEASEAIMDLKKGEWEYDCGDTDNKFSNLSPEMQKWWKDYSAKCDAWEKEQDKKEAADKH